MDDHDHRPAEAGNPRNGPWQARCLLNGIETRLFHGYRPDGTHLLNGAILDIHYTVSPAVDVSHRL